MDWITQNSAFLSFVTSILMLVVWVVYLQVFLQSYRRQLRANVVISRGAGTGLDSLCLVSNMGAEPIVIEGMIVIAENGERRGAAVTNFSDIVGDSAATRRPAREGPLKSGEYITVGTFRDLVGIADPAGGDPPRASVLEIWIVADFASENALVFARRRFHLAARGDRTVIRPAELETRRITRTRERREVEEMLQRHLEEAMDLAPEPAAR